MSTTTDPFTRFEAWFSEAEAAEPRVHDAAQVATVDADGRPSVRTILLKDHGPDGFVFYTNAASRKGQALAAHPVASLCLHWKSLQRQVIVEGPVDLVDDDVADAYWATRPRGSQLGAWASRQSEVLPSRTVLHARLQETTQRFEGRDVPRPPGWTGHRVQPLRIEFWQGREDRLHERELWTRGITGWESVLLFP